MGYYMYDRTEEITPYERYFAALNGERLDRVPVMYYPRWVALEYAGITFSESWQNPDEHVRAQIVAQERFQYDATIDFDMMGPVEEAMGAVLKYPEDDVPQIEDPPIKTKDDMKKIKWKINAYTDGNIPRVLYAVRRLKEELIKRGNGRQRVPISTWGSSPARTAACLTGFKNWFMIVAKQPDWAQELMDLALDGWVQQVKACWENGVDHVWINDPVSSRDCISRKHYEELTQPMQRKFIEAIRRETGMKTVFHPCGNWHDRLDLIFENQASGYFLGPMDIDLCCAEGKKIMEKGTNPHFKCFTGNVGAATKSTITDGQTAVPYGTTLKYGTPEEILEESKYVIDATEKAGIRLMLGTNCWDTKGTPMINRDAITYAARCHGRFSQMDFISDEEKEAIAANVKATLQKQRA